MDRKVNAHLRLSSRSVLCFLSGGLWGLVAVPLCAQVAGARIAGTVSDGSGAAIVDASESFNIQFRAKFFNVLNHTNFSPLVANNNLYTANGLPVTTAGLITTTATSSRQLQFGLKIAW